MFAQGAARISDMFLMTAQNRPENVIALIQYAFFTKSREENFNDCRKKSSGFFLTVFAVLSLDRLSKMFVAELTVPGSSYSVLPFLEIVHYRNTGIAFGMLQGLGGTARFVLFGGALVAALFFCRNFFKKEHGREVFSGFDYRRRGRKLN